MKYFKVIEGDARKVDIPEQVKSIVTSPPYWRHRDYGVDDQIGIETKPDLYIDQVCSVFDHIRQFLSDDGTCWVVIGDTYSTHTSGSKSKRHNFSSTKRTNKHGIGVMDKGDPGMPEKNLMGIPWMFATEMRNRGWIIRNDIIWDKGKSGMPGGQGSVFDRFANCYEHIFMFSKNPKYFFNGDSVRTSPTQRPGDVWRINTAVNRKWSAHCAVFPEEIPKRCILASTKPGDFVLDPFSGSGTTGVASIKHRRGYIGVEVNPEFVELSIDRLKNTGVTVDWTF